MAELTPREREILELMARGRSNAGICEELWITQKTLESHIRSIFRKLGLRAVSNGYDRRVVAVLTYLREHQTP